jgi:hypothetical protein
MADSPNYAALAAQAGATASTNVASQPAQPPTQTTPQPNVDYASLAQQAGATASSNPSVGGTQPEGAISRFVSGAYHEVADPIASAAHGLLDEPRDATEHVISSTGVPGALQAYRAAKEVTDQVKNTLKAPSEGYQQAKQDLAKAIIDLHNGNWRQGLADAGSTTADIYSMIPGSVPGVGQRARALSEGTRPGGDLATPLGQSTADLGMAALDSDTAKTVGGKVLDTATAAKDAVVKPFQTPDYASTLRDLAGTDIDEPKAAAFNRSVELAAPDVADIANNTRFKKIGNARVQEFVDALRDKADSVLTDDPGGSADDLLKRSGALDHIADTIEGNSANSEPVKHIGLKELSQRVAGGAVAGGAIPFVGGPVGALAGGVEAVIEEIGNRRLTPGAKLDRMLQGLRDASKPTPEDFSSMSDEFPPHPFNTAPETRPNAEDFTPTQIKTLQNLLRSRAGADFHAGLPVPLDGDVPSTEAQSGHGSDDDHTAISDSQ